MTFVLTCYAKQANTLTITATIHFQRLVVFSADFLLLGFRVRLGVSGTVREQAHQARLDSLQLRHGGKITVRIH